MPAGTPVEVRLPDEELSALDRYRREKLDPPSRSRALSELAHIALVGFVISLKPDAIESAQERAKAAELATIKSVTSAGIVRNLIMFRLLLVASCLNSPPRNCAITGNGLTSC